MRSLVPIVSGGKLLECNFKIPVSHDIIVETDRLNQKQFRQRELSAIDQKTFKLHRETSWILLELEVKAKLLKNRSNFVLEISENSKRDR